MRDELVSPSCPSLKAALEGPGFLYKGGEATGNGGVLLLLGQKRPHGFLKRFERAKAIVSKFEGPLLKWRPKESGEEKRGSNRLTFPNPGIGTF